MFDDKNHFQAWRELMKASDESSIGIPCTNYPDAFFTEAGYPVDAARSLCNECPIKTMCAEYGIAYEHDGVYGGLSPHERRQIRSLRNLKPLTAQRVTEPI